MPAPRIRSADAVIICLSKNLVNKPGYAQKEIRQILDMWEEKPEGEIFVIPVRIEECDIPEALKRVHYVDWFGDQEEMEKNYQKIQGYCNKDYGYYPSNQTKKKN